MKIHRTAHGENFPSIYHVEAFHYNGYMVTPKPGFTDYQVKSFIAWTNDPGIGLFKCADKNKLRTIPSCQLHPDFLKKFDKQIIK